MTDLKVMVCPSDAKADAEEAQHTLDLINAGDPNGENQIGDSGIRNGAPFDTPRKKEIALQYWLGSTFSYGFFTWACTTDDCAVGMRCGREAARGTTPDCPYTSDPTAFGRKYCNYDHDYDLTKLTLKSGAYGTPYTRYSTEINAAIAQGLMDHVPLVLGSANGPIVYRIREGIERFFITDVNNPSGSAMAQSAIPFAFDGFGGTRDPNSIEDFNHLPGGCNVLYMDGHVEFVKYPGRFPIDAYIGIEASIGYKDTSTS
ncbi:MAG: hypothetical protein J7M12_03390 [Candidatus Hydrogenedentes bacterium]|nr:hypothetical protein [Candidatus Hydrogenedentota bacterium]